MRNSLKFVLITLPVIAIGAGFLGYKIKTKAPPAQIVVSERVTDVRVVPAMAGSVSPRVRGYGLVAPARTFEAIAQVSGRVDWVNPDLKRGAILPAGTVLARIAAEDYALAVAQAEANIRSAEAKLAELAVSEDNQRAALEIEREALELKQADLSRAERLNAGGTLPQAGLDAARAAALGQRQKVQSIESTLALIPTQRAVQAEQIAVSQAAAETARLNLARTELTLPFEARVASVAVETGRFLRAGEVAAVLDGTDVAEVEAQVPVARLRELLRLSAPDAAAYAVDPAAMTMVLQGLELTADLRLDLGGETLSWTGRVARVSDTVDPRTGTLGIIVEVQDAYDAATPGDRPPLTKGMFLEVEIAGRPVSGILLPRAALDGGRVWIVGRENRLDFAEVTPVFVEDDLALVSDGVDPGALVLVSDIAVPIAGMLLAPIIDDALTAGLEAAE